MAPTREWLLSLSGHAVLFGLLFLGLRADPPVAGTGLSVVIENPMPAPAGGRSSAPTKPRKTPAKLKQQPPRLSQASRPEQSSEEVVASQNSALGTGAANTTGVAGNSAGYPSPVAEYLVTDMPELISEVRIPYPPGARERKAQGPVVMDLLIDESGAVRRSTLVEGVDPDLSRAALEAIKGFRFKPARVNDKKVAVLIRYVYRFVLDR